MVYLPKGFSYTLSLLPWQLFSTITFKNPLPPETAGWALAWRHLHRVAEFLGTPYSVLLIALRSEHGELGDRPHFHYLLGASGSSNTITLAHRLEYSWKQLSGGAHPEIRPYNPLLAGADYIEGCLGGGNLYEIGKFNRSDRLELSASVFRVVRYGLRSYWQNSACKGSRENTGSPSLTPVTVGERGTADGPAVAIGAADNPLLSPA